MKSTTEAESHIKHPIALQTQWAGYWVVSSQGLLCLLSSVVVRNAEHTHYIIGFHSCWDHQRAAPGIQMLQQGLKLDFVSNGPAFHSCSQQFTEYIQHPIRSQTFMYIEMVLLVCDKPPITCELAQGHWASSKSGRMTRAQVSDPNSVLLLVCKRVEDAVGTGWGRGIRK